jgi:hypothetical protein
VRRQPAGVELVLGDAHDHAILHDAAGLVAHDAVPEPAHLHGGEIVDELLAEEALSVGAFHRVDGRQRQRRAQIRAGLPGERLLAPSVELHGALERAEHGEALDVAPERDDRVERDSGRLGHHDPLL